MVNNDLLTSSLCLIIGILFFIGSLNYPYLGSIFPAVISLALIIMSIILFIKSLINPEMSGWITNVKLKNVFLIALSIILYVLIIPILGIIVTSTIYIIGFALVASPKVDYRIIITSVIVALVVSGSFSYIFIKYFYVPLPSVFFVS